MPKRLPIRDLVVGLLRGILRAVRYWLHYTLVALAWLGIVPLTACKYSITTGSEFYSHRRNEDLNSVIVMHCLCTEIVFCDLKCLEL